MVFKNPIYKEISNVTVVNVGGVVTSAHPSFIESDRLSDGFNVWNKNGMLSSRPGIKATESGFIGKDFSSSDEKVYYSDFPAPDTDGYNKFCAIVKNSGKENPKIDFFAIDKLGAVHTVSSIDLSDENVISQDIKNLIFIKSKKITGSGIFVILPVCKKTVALEEVKEVQYFELSEDFLVFNKVEPESLYRPIIIKNGHGNLATGDIRREYKESRPEGVSLLNGLFEARFIIDGTSYSFACGVPFAEDAPIEIRYYTSDASHRTVTVAGGSTRSDNFTYMGLELYITVNRKLGKIFFRKDGDFFVMPKVADIESLRIYSSCDVTGAAYEIFSSSVTPILFDSRLFIAGGENRGNKVYYSSKTEHLYFCEDYSMSVGNKSYDLTALSMQSKYIIAFKEREMYRLSITCTDEISMQKIELDNKGLVFEKPKCTVTQINDTIGCDLPDTIVTCANRLVWFHSDGVVYTLYGSNLYTEGSIYELSSDISNLLADINEDRLKYAFAADFNGYYVLGLYDRLFLMDVRVSGFRYLTAQKHRKNNDVSWFLWSAPKESHFVSGFLIGGKEYFVMSFGDDHLLYTAQMQGETDVILKDGEREETIPEFSFSTAIFGKSSSAIDRVCINARLKEKAELSFFDENREFGAFSITPHKDFKSYILSSPYKKGGIGIKIKGRGPFMLKDLVCSFKERIY